jgi:acyl-CoA synthetase (AMP-forming)/AMP-acid ligase II
LRRPGTALASALAGMGLRRQDRIAILGKNSIEFGQVMAAAWSGRGHVPSPVGRAGSLTVERISPLLVYLVDRKKDMITSGGENVYSPEVEEAVLTLPAVAACAVIGVPDERWGEAVCAVVVPAPGGTVTSEAVQEQVRQRLARYKVPRRVVVAEALPVLATGKIDKKQLRALYDSAG